MYLARYIEQPKQILTRELLQEIIKDEETTYNRGSQATPRVDAVQRAVEELLYNPTFGGHVDKTAGKLGQVVNPSDAAARIALAIHVLERLREFTKLWSDGQ